MNNGAKQASLDCNRASFTLQYSLCCLTKEPLFHTNSGSVGVEERLFLYIMGATLKQNTAKTARQISKINFYFVTAFYSLYYICMGRQMIKDDNRDNRDNRLRIETNTLYTKVVSIVSIVVKKESCKDMFFRHDMLSDKKTCAEWLQHPHSCIIFVKRTASRIHPMHNFAKFV